MKKLKDLTVEQLKIVFDKNEKLRVEVFKDMFDCVDGIAIEILRNFDLKALSYEIDVSHFNHHCFIVKDRRSFAESLVDVNNMYGVLDEDSTQQLNRVIHLIDHFDDVEYDLSDVNYTRLDKRIDEVIDTLKNKLYKFIWDEYDAIYDDSNQLDYYLDFYSSERMSDDYYIDDNYILWEHIEYEKCYK